MSGGKNRIKLAISPCPNDTFIFGPMILGLTDQQYGLTKTDIQTDYFDIQTLNELALFHKYDIIKVSAAHALSISDHYDFFTCGGAMGLNCGPLLITKNEIDSAPINTRSVILPGKNTTARFLFEFAFPEAKSLFFGTFSEIEDLVQKEVYPYGVIIHENRFTYQSKGLVKILDLGEYWNQETGFPIPLGLIGVKKELDINLKIKIKDQIVSSLAYATEHVDQIFSYIKSHAQELDKEVIFQHIDLYVNEFSHDLGDTGKSAVNELFKSAQAAKTTSTINFI
ncbi:MAG: 1,4-dihydroxy-6-naphthoate synthase [Saprospiraceae bacterium]|nr:1,4-dihydroxy-6-naphthoate synthase [Candidatus Vicinibacter affinis]